MRRLRRTHWLVGTLIVFALTACGGGDGGANEAAAASGDAGDAGGGIAVEAGDLYFDPEEISASAGEVTITLENTGQAQHDFVIEEAGDAEVVSTAPGQTATGSIELEAGTYTYYCSVPGHRSAMEGTLQVS